MEAEELKLWSYILDPIQNTNEEVLAILKHIKVDKYLGPDQMHSRI